MSMALAAHIKLLMQEHGGMNETDLARAIGVPQPTIHRLIAGKTQKPKEDILQRIATFFSTTVATLRAEETKSNAFVEIPVFSVTSLELNGENKKLYKTVDTIIIKDNGASQHFFGIYIDNENYGPLFLFGSTIILDKVKHMKDRDTAVFYDKVNNKLYIEKIVIDNNDIYYKKKASVGKDEILLQKITKDAYRIFGVIEEIRYKIS